MPQCFPFYNPASHQRIVRALESARPLAVLAATRRNPELAGGVYPFPLIEDGDFHIPTAFLKEEEGARLLPHAGRPVTLHIDSGRHRSTAPQVIARNPGRGRGRLVFFAHLDTKHGTPGALDDATGVCALLGLAELLSNYQGLYAIELVPFNGEDNYATPGQRHWLAANQGRMGDIVAGFNVDGAGLAGARTAVSFYDCPAPVRRAVEEAMAVAGFVEGPPWPQGDHSLLALHGVPAGAVTSQNAFFVTSTVAHTEKDTPELVDVGTVADVARFLAAVAGRLVRSEGQAKRPGRIERPRTR